ncbi:MAG: prenyltransferase [Bacteroidales bacterium]|nr:prenyltransferase [Bacteroidales bacterium]
MNKIHFWLKNARYVALPQSILPAVLAVFMASDYADFSFLYALLAVVGVLFTHLSMNLFDDYFDYKNQNIQIRNELAEHKILARIGKCDYLIEQKATAKQLLFVASAFLFMALIIGTVIFLHRGNVILYLAFIGGFLGLAYSAKPFCLSYRGLGEIVVGVMFGPLLMAGVFYASCGACHLGLVLVSASAGLLVTNILFTHSIMDYQPDKHTGKKTLAILIHSVKGMFIISCFFNLLPFALIGYGILTHYLSLWYLLVFLPFPLAGYLIYLIAELLHQPQKRFKPQYWMGPMENWNAITRAGTDWFMIRWYLARNLTVFFCVFAIIASLLSPKL